MVKMTYTQLINKTLELYLQGDYLKAYDFITYNAGKVKGNRAQIYNFRYSIACQAGLKDLAMNILKEAINEKEYWYPYSLLAEDDDLKPLHDYKDFNKLADICKKREIKAQKDCKPDLKVMFPDNMSDKNYPLIIALHGNQENMQITSDYWKACIKNKRILALPQSSQIEFSDAYNWSNLIKGREELKTHYKAILTNYKIDPENIIIGGFSAGARVVMYSLLNNDVQAKGLILVGPWLPEIKKQQYLFEKLKCLKCYIICGNKDEDCYQGSKELAEILNERNIPCRFNVVEGLNHDYPSDFNRLLERAIKYINE